MKRLSPSISSAMAIASLAIAALGCVPARHAPTPATDRGALVLRLGPDTLIVERFELTRNRLYVESVVRSPRLIFRTIDAALNGDGSFESLRVAEFDPALPRGQARDSTIVTFSADSTFYAFGTGPTKQSMRLPGRGGFVLSFPGTVTFANHILLAARAPRAPGDSLMVTLTSRLGAEPVTVKRLSRDTVTIASQLAGLVRVLLGPDGRTVALDGTGSSLGYVGTRLSWIDIDSVSRAFVARERVAGPVGTLSRRDTVVADIEGARILIDYGRPSKRGRAIFGTVVPWNRLWRTGANLATHFSTSRPLELEGVALAAGTYALYTIPAPDQWTLIVSSETGLWGSAAPDPSRFVARVPMRVSAGSDVVETLTISVNRTAVGGMLRIAWDGTAAEASFIVR